MSKYEIILDVYNTCSFAKTAEKFNYTQSAVSQIVKNYEKNIGLPLFKKAHNTIEPLPNTKRIIEELRKIYEAEQNILSISSKLNNLESGFIRIGTIQSIAYHWLPDILKDFSNAYPGIQFEIYVHGFQELDSLLKNDKLDLCFTSEYAVPNMEFSPLGTDELLLVTPRNHKLSEKLYVSFPDIAGTNYISSADKLDYEIGQLFLSYQIHPTVKYELNDDFAVLKMVEAGFGITILPKLLLAGAPFDVCIRPFTEHFTRTLGVAYPNTKHLSPAATVFLTYAHKWYIANCTKSSKIDCGKTL